MAIQKVFTVVVLMTFCIFVLCVTLLSGKSDNFNDIDNSGARYGASIFTKFEGDVYAAVPSNGYYPLSGVDLESFTPLDSRRYGVQIAKDKHNVYCGNRIVPGVNPENVSSFGSGYIVDGVVTYYCAAHPTRNDDLSVWQEVLQTILYRFELGGKPQAYLYLFVRLPQEGAVYRPLLDRDFATDGVHVYYRGLSLLHAIPESFRRINVVEDGSSRLSDHYFADGQHVYYDDQLLPLSDDSRLYGFYYGRLDQPYIYDVRDGMVYLRSKAFDKVNAPYRRVTENSAHTHHALFSGVGGELFYVDNETDRVKQARRNPLSTGPFKALSPSVFYDGRRILYLQGAEVWGGNKSPGLKSHSTRIYQLQDVVAEPWRNLGEVDYRTGSVWKNGKSYYYFDELGMSQGVRSAIYRIENMQTVNFLLTPLTTKRIGSGDIRRLIREGKLTVPEYTQMLEIKTRR